MDITIKELNEKIALINSIGTEAIDASGKRKPINDKVTYAIKRFEKAYHSAVDKIQRDSKEEIEEALEGLRIKYASVDKDGVLMTDGDKYRYTSEKALQLNKEIRETVRESNDKLLSTKVTIHPYYMVGGEGFERIENLDYFTREELEGILFEPTSEPTTVEAQ